MNNRSLLGSSTSPISNFVVEYSSTASAVKLAVASASIVKLFNNLNPKRSGIFLGLKENDRKLDVEVILLAFSSSLVLKIVLPASFDSIK